MNKKIQKNKGMTYVELIVVLGIFSVLLSVSLFNYKKFEGKVDIKNLANDVALKIVEAQKSSVSGKLGTFSWGTYKPAYGIYLNSSTPTKFIYFADLNNSNSCDNAGSADSNCAPQFAIGREVTDIINITRGNYISSLQAYCGATPTTLTSVSAVFRRPSSTPTITTSPSAGCTISYIAINISSPVATQAYTSQIKLYPSGRIQIN